MVVMPRLACPIGPHHIRGDVTVMGGLVERGPGRYNKSVRRGLCELLAWGEGRSVSRVGARVAAPALMVAVAAAVLLLASGSGARGPRSARAGLESLPVAARGPVSAALGRGDPGYRIRGFVGVNVAQRLRVRFIRSGVRVVSGSARLGLSLLGFGRGGA